MAPKISIVTITYNSEKTLEETILSVTGQGYDNLEYLIIDGGSTDKTLSIVEKYRDQIAVVVSETDKGISDAFNKGVRKATGEIIGIINSDDILLPGALTKIAQAYNPKTDVYSGLMYFWNDKTDEKILYRPDLTFDKLKLQYSVTHQSRFIRKDAYERFGMFMEEMKYMMDIDLLCRFYHQGAVFQLVDAPLALFRMGGTTNNSIYKKKEDYRLFVKNFGGSQWDFRWIWLQAVVKYNLIQLGYKLFGSNLRFKLNKIFKTTDYKDYTDFDCKDLF